MRPAAEARPASVLLVAVACLALLVAGCGRGSESGPSASTGPGVGAARQPSPEEAERLASARLNAYRAGTRIVEGATLSDRGAVQLRGWIDTAEHWAYGLVTGPGIEPFLVVWDESAVSVQPFAGTQPPLPVPAAGWQTAPLDPASSHLAAAQVLLVSLSDSRPENPQLLMQNGVTWLRDDVLGDVPVDVMTGPVPAGSSSSSYRYWIDDDGNLLRLEARLDGVHWSSFTFTDADGVTLEHP